MSLTPRSGPPLCSAEAASLPSLQSLFCHRISPLLISVGKHVPHWKMGNYLGPPSASGFFYFSLAPCISD